mmetsp:Transcript_23578/g.42594  ORF Transcript_23578/g.42594 Transcript_23578/m.42594 type:complete len:741 (+) Transcript_23578:36-2258(+)
MSYPAGNAVLHQDIRAAAPDVAEAARQAASAALQRVGMGVEAPPSMSRRSLASEQTQLVTSSRDIGSPLSPSPAYLSRDAKQEREMTAATEATAPPEASASFEERLQNERRLWSAAIEQCQAEMAQALQSMSDYVDRKVRDTLSAVQSVSQRSSEQLEALDAVSMAVSDLEVRYQTDRTERGADLMEVRSDLDRQWEELSKGVMASAAESEERAQKEQREVLSALAAVCEDIESLRLRQKEQDSSFEEPLKMASAAAASGLSRLSAEIEDLRQQQGREQRELQDTLRSDLQRLLVEELQVRRLNELEALQSEDSRHRRDIDALREQQSRSLEALRNEEAMHRQAAEARWRTETQGIRLQLTSCLEAVSGSHQIQERLASMEALPVSDEALGAELRLEVKAEAAKISDRLNADIAALRAQLTEAFGEVRTQQARQGGEIQMLRSDCDAAVQAAAESKSILKELGEHGRDSQAHESDGLQRREEHPASTGGVLQKDVEALGLKFESEIQTLMARLGMQGRDIEDLQKQLLDSDRNSSSTRQRLSDEIDELRQEQDRGRVQLQQMLDLEKKRDSGDWSLFKAFSGCHNATPLPPTVAPPDGSSPDEVVFEQNPPPRRNSPKVATSEELESVRAMHFSDLRDLRQQQRSFFDEALLLADTSHKQLRGELEAVRSQCNTSMAGLQTQQSNTLEVVRNQQRRLEQVQGQLLGDVGAIKTQMVENLRSQRLPLPRSPDRMHETQVIV